MATINLPDNYATGATKDEIGKVFAEHYLPADKVDPQLQSGRRQYRTQARRDRYRSRTGPVAQSKGRTGQFHSNLAAANIDRNTVDTVIISHFHGDHINGLLAAEDKPAFANAEIMVPAAEWKFWMDDGEMSKGMGNPILENNFKNIRRVFDAIGRKVTPYEFGQGIGARHHLDGQPRSHARSYLLRRGVRL